jgi:hypothetical protein
VPHINMQKNYKKDKIQKIEKNVEESIKNISLRRIYYNTQEFAKD